MSSSITLITDSSEIAEFNHGPITSAFTAPSSCTETFTLRKEASRGLYFGHSGEPYVDKGCYPTPTPGVDLVDKDSWNSYYYSPAFCPNGWEAATTWTSSIPGGKSTRFVSIGPEITALLCCPSGFKYAKSGHICASEVTQNQIVKYFHPTHEGASIERGPVSTSQFPSSSMIYGDGIPVWFQQSDVPVLSAVATMVAPTPTPTSSSEILTSRISSGGPTGIVQSAANSTSPSSEVAPPSHESGLSSSAKIAIGVSVPAAFLVGVFTCIFILCLRRYRRAAPEKSHEILVEAPDTQQRTELPPTFANLTGAHNDAKLSYSRHELA